MANEKRLIDANKARVVAQRIYSDPVLVHAILNTLNETPTVDAVEVVRCKDCKGWCSEEIAKAYNAPRYCTLTGIPTDADDFCSYGERRTDNA